MGIARQSTAGERFDAIYSGIRRTVALRRAQRAVYGDEYPDEIVPYGFTTRSELRRIARELGVGRGQCIADIGCGEGGAGLWVARETGADLVGIDVSPVAVARAQERVAAFGLHGTAAFAVGDFVATGLPTASCDGGISLDVLQFVPDKGAALREVARILRPGASFIFATSESSASPPDEPQVADHRPLLRDAGFAVEAYDPTQGWEHTFRAIAAGMEGARDAIAAEVGAAIADASIAQMRERAARLPGWRRVFIVARRP